MVSGTSGVISEFVLLHVEEETKQELEHVPHHRMVDCPVQEVTVILNHVIHKDVVRLQLIFYNSLSSLLLSLLCSRLIAQF